MKKVGILMLFSEKQNEKLVKSSLSMESKLFGVQWNTCIASDMTMTTKDGKKPSNILN